MRCFCRPAASFLTILALYSAAMGLAPLAGTRGPLVALGGITWTEADPEFGGLSGLVVAPDGASLIVVGDGAWLFHGIIVRDSKGRLVGVTMTRREKLWSREGKLLTPFTSDSEDLAADPSGDGTLWVAFEGMTRVFRYPPPAPGEVGRNAIATAVWNKFEPLFGNKGFEALAILPDGRAIAIPQRDIGDGAPQIRLYADEKWQDGPVLPDMGGWFTAHWQVTGAAWGPDRRLWVLERLFGLLGNRTRIRSFALGDGPGGLILGRPQLMLDGWLGLSLIWEGIALRRVPGGIVATLVSDNNQLPLLHSRVAEFLLPNP